MYGISQLPTWRTDGRTDGATVQPDFIAADAARTVVSLRCLRCYAVRQTVAVAVTGSVYQPRELRLPWCFDLTRPSPRLLAPSPASVWASHTVCQLIGQVRGRTYGWQVSPARTPIVESTVIRSFDRLLAAVVRRRMSNCGCGNNSVSWRRGLYRRRR